MRHLSLPIWWLCLEKKINMITLWVTTKWQAWLISTEIFLSLDISAVAEGWIRHSQSKVLLGLSWLRMCVLEPPSLNHLEREGDGESSTGPDAEPSVDEDHSLQEPMQSAPLLQQTCSWRTRKMNSLSWSRIWAPDHLGSDQTLSSSLKRKKINNQKCWLENWMGSNFEQLWYYSNYMNFYILHCPETTSDSGLVGQSLCLPPPLPHSV